MSREIWGVGGSLNQTERTRSGVGLGKGRENGQEITNDVFLIGCKSITYCISFDCRGSEAELMLDGARVSISRGHLHGLVAVQY